MAMHVEQVGGRFVAAMAVLLAVAGNAAFAQEHKTFRCKLADVVHLGEDGRLRLDSNPKDMMRYLYDGVVVNTLTGAVTYPDGNRVVWNVVQRGRENDYVLTRKPKRVVLITECSMADNVAADAPFTEFVRPCNLCPHMKRITLENIYEALLHDRYEVTVDPAIALRARLAVQRMVDLPPPQTPARYDLVRARHQGAAGPSKIKPH